MFLLFEVLVCLIVDIVYSHVCVLMSRTIVHGNFVYLYTFYRCGYIYQFVKKYARWRIR